MRNRVAVFTSIDATLLDAKTFEPGINKKTIAQFESEGIAVVPVTLMTLDEIAPIASALGLRHAMVTEAGGAIARWAGDGWEIEACGAPAEALLDAIRHIEERSGANLLVYSALPHDQASRLSGRRGEMLEASRHRRFSEPFIIESGDLEAVRRAAEEIGLSVRRGRRFFHLCRTGNDGGAFERLRKELRCDITIGVGGSMVDAEFLRRADVPIIVPMPDEPLDPELIAAVPAARIATEPAPNGWSVAVLEALTKMRTVATGNVSRQ